MAKKSRIGEPVKVYNAGGESYGGKSVKQSAARATHERIAHGAEASPPAADRYGVIGSGTGRGVYAGSQPSTTTGRSGKDYDPSSKGRGSKSPASARKKKSGYGSGIKGRGNR